MNTEYLWSEVLHLLGRAWWIEITTERPACIYYFGPFATQRSADLSQAGYLEDLEGEGAQEIAVKIERCHPTVLTIEQASSRQQSLPLSDWEGVGS